MDVPAWLRILCLSARAATDLLQAIFLGLGLATPNEFRLSSDVKRGRVSRVTRKSIPGGRWFSAWRCC